MGGLGFARCNATRVSSYKDDEETTTHKREEEREKRKEKREKRGREGKGEEGEEGGEGGEGGCDCDREAR